MPASTSHQSPFKKSSWLQTTKILAAALAQDKQIPSNRQVRQDAKKEKQPQIDADERRLIVAFSWRPWRLLAVRFVRLIVAVDSRYTLPNGHTEHPQELARGWFVIAQDVHQLAGRIKAMARELGFDLAGIAPASPSRYRDYFRQWLDDGRAGTMDWLSRRFDERVDPAVYFPGVKSVVCLAINYYVTLDAPAPTPSGASNPTGRVARYALGNDYHTWIKRRLHTLADWMRQSTGCQTRCGVDTAPIMEKELAAQAGIGWLGKNSCIIHDRLGSWLFLGEILTDLELPADQPAVDRCGTCRRCIDACPTAAITAPYQLDATKCISYLTIEHDGPIDAALQPKINDWLFGCDICQDVCPFNTRAPSSSDPDVQPRLPDGRVNLADLMAWDVDRYRQQFRDSAVRRVSLPILQRNAGMALRRLP